MLRRLTLFTLVALIVLLGARTASAATITGTIFEDVNYGGGAGRSLAAAGTAGIPNVVVELYDGVGNLSSSTTTNASGTYTLHAAANLFYTIRVVNATVGSSRPGGTAPGIMPVQTFRTNASTGIALPVTDHVGGETPTKVDAEQNTAYTSLSSLTTSTATPQSITTVLLNVSTVSGVDFGFNFDTVVNTADSPGKGNAAQGTLGQFLVNANALANTTLAQVGQPGGQETSIFMISDGNAHPGLRAGLSNSLSGGVALIALAANYPPITRANVAIDGGTQTTNVGDTNSGLLGTGGVVGVDGVTLSQVAAPEVQISGGNAYSAVQVQPSATGFILRKVALYALATSLAEMNATGALIEQNVIGTTATAFAPATRASAGLSLLGASSGTLRNNLIGYALASQVTIATSATWSVQNNEIRSSNASGSSVSACVTLLNAGSSGSISLTGNRIANCTGQAVTRATASTLTTLTNNTISANGLGVSGGVTPALGGAIELDGAATVVTRNVITNNYGAGILIAPGGAGFTLSRNSLSNNGTMADASGNAASHEIGIDLLGAAQTVPAAPYVNPNKAGGTASGADSLLNFPVFDSAFISGGNLVLTGIARPGATIELFSADATPANGFGQGKTYLTTLTEGSAADNDSTTGSYNNPGGNTLVGTDTSNRFRFTIPLPSGVSAGTALTSTATLAPYGTSEFGPNISVSATATRPTVALVLGVSPGGAQAPGTDLTYTTSFTNSSAQAFSLVASSALPPNTDFKLGSVATSLTNTNLTVSVQYSNDGGSTWTYTPVSGGGGAASGYDRSVTNLRFVFSGSLGPVSPYNLGSYSFTARIQ